MKKLVITLAAFALITGCRWDIFGPFSTGDEQNRKHHGKPPVHSVPEPWTLLTLGAGLVVVGGIKSVVKRGK